MWITDAPNFKFLTCVHFSWRTTKRKNTLFLKIAKFLVRNYYKVTSDGVVRVVVKILRKYDCNVPSSHVHWALTPTKLFLAVPGFHKFKWYLVLEKESRTWLSCPTASHSYPIHAIWHLINIHGCRSVLHLSSVTFFMWWSIAPGAWPCAELDKNKLEVSSVVCTALLFL